MNLMTPFEIALEALLLNKARSLLTTLGIIIGVAAVIAMMSIGEGAKGKVKAAFDSLGTNMLVVTSGSNRTGGVMSGAGSQPTLTWDDLRAIRTELPSVLRVSPIMGASAQVASADTNWNTRVSGVSPEFFVIRNWTIATGSFFTKQDDDSANKVAVVGRTVINNLYGRAANPIGETMRIKNIPFQIIGILAVKGQNAMGQDNDDTVMVPAKTFLTKVQGTSLQNMIPGAIFVQATSAEATSAAERQIHTLLRDRHRIARVEDEDFTVRNLQEIFAAQESSISTFTTLLAAVAGVSLLVGGIGIMNIMLVSVTERTKEIGLRMAIGATPQVILQQFLVEAITLSVAGGVIGIFLGVTSAYLLSARFGWAMVFQPGIMALSAGVSALVGVFFGLYPAQRAARLDPIEALRHE
ncbi:MAG: ABC transporter permease [SAR324 cluster bacterium]